MAAPLPDRAQAVLDFWFGDVLEASDAAGVKQVSSKWFNGGEAFDQAIESQFGGLPEKLSAGEADNWAHAGPHGRLAAIIALDQFPRNIHRGSAKAFAFDPIALHLANEGLLKGEDKLLHPLERIFFYLPLEHSENLDDQRRSVELFDALRRDADAPSRNFIHDAWVFAVKHLEFIKRFGRFPHRNAVLGRTSTAEEIEFLKQPGSRF